MKAGQQQEGVLDLDVIRFEGEAEKDLIDTKSDHSAILTSIYDSAKTQIKNTQVCLVFLALLQDTPQGFESVLQHVQADVHA